MKGIVRSVDGVPAAVILLLEAGADASVSSEPPASNSQMLAALRPFIPLYLDSIETPVTDALVSEVYSSVSECVSLIKNVPSNYLVSVNTFAAYVPYLRACQRAINERQTRGRVGISRTLEDQAVRLFGLKTADLNNIVASCGAFDCITDRYSVKINSPDGVGRIVSVRSRNVEAVDRQIIAGTACASCLSSHASLSCSGCHRVRYCNDVCQRKHWKEGHKPICQAARRTRQTVTLQRPSPKTKCDITCLTNSAGTRMVKNWDISTMEALCGHTAVIKASPVVGDDTASILIYDEARYFFAEVTASDPAHGMILAITKSTPHFGGSKAYFNCMFSRSECGIFIDATIDLKPLFHQSWI